MDMFEKLKILSAAAKFDAACTSSGVDRKSPEGGVGNATACGICHSFAGDGRCISLLKILMSNACVYNCAYCVNRCTNDTPRATFTPREIADLTINFYRRNYIEGLFLSSGVLGDPNRTTDLMIEALRILREEYKFYGYIHAKAIPGADEDAIERLGALCDRISCNIELPSNESLTKLAPNKSKESILKPMGFIKQRILGAKELGYSKKLLSAPSDTPPNMLPAAPQQGLKPHKRFAPAGQSTQMIIGASPETDFSILKLTEALYDKYKLKRVFFSAYVPVADNSNLPSIGTKPPLLRENRLYQADWLLRFYNFKADEILDENNPVFNPYLDPKCNWAVNHPEFFPVEINKAPYETLLRVPGIGVLSAQKILRARRGLVLGFEDLKKLGVVLKRARYFILCAGKPMYGVIFSQKAVLDSLLSKSAIERMGDATYCRQISMFQDKVGDEDVIKCLNGQI